MVPTNYLWNFWNFENWNFNNFFSYSLTWDLMEVKISKRYSSYKSQLKFFKPFLNFFLMVLTKLRLGFWNFENYNFNEFYSFMLTWDPMGAKFSKQITQILQIACYKSQANVLKLVLNFPPNGPHKTSFGIFEIYSFWFLTIGKFTIVAYGEIKTLNYLENQRS